MALIKCKECGREISSAANSCPHCGAPVQPHKTIESNSKSYIKLSLFVGVAFGIVGVFLVGSYHDFPRNIGAFSIFLCVLAFIAAIAFYIKAKNEATTKNETRPTYMIINNALNETHQTYTRKRITKKMICPGCGRVFNEDEILPDKCPVCKCESDFFKYAAE